jgi:RHS repeat-associated protein
VAEYDTSTSAIQRRYVHGPGVDEPLVWYEGPGTTAKSWLYADPLGSIIATANAAGASTTINTYGPFGESAQTTPDNNRFGYTGQQHLKGLGLYHYKARVYSPALGRFLQTDPIGYADDLNLYGYVGNDSINQRDPTGNCPSCAVGAFTSVVMGGGIRYLTSGGNWSAVFDAKSIAIDATLGAVGTGLITKGTNLISAYRAGATNIERNVTRGALGESMVGIPSAGKTVVNSGGVKIVPDRLTATTLDEVKNVAAISAKDARQIGAEAAFAEANGLQMTLFVRPGANLSKIQGLVDSGAFAVETIPGVARNGFRALTAGESAGIGAGIGAASNSGTGGPGK